jgi:hypothetical protein
MLLDGYSIRYGEGEPWKNVAAKYGTTHPSRRDKAMKRNLPDKSNDGRAPNSNKALAAAEKTTMKADAKASKSALAADEKAAKKALADADRASKKALAIAKKAEKAVLQKLARSEDKRPWLYMQRELHRDGLRLYRDGSYQSYPWNGESSCWLDASLEALFFSYLNCRDKFEDTMNMLPEVDHLAVHMSRRMQAYNLKETAPDLQTELSELRDNLAILLDLDIHVDSNPLVCTRISYHLIVILELVSYFVG